MNKLENKISFKLIRGLLSYWESWEAGSLSLMPISMHLSEERKKLSNELINFGDFFYALSVEITQTDSSDQLARLMNGFIERENGLDDID